MAVSDLKNEKRRCANQVTQYNSKLQQISDNYLKLEAVRDKIDSLSSELGDICYYGENTFMDGIDESVWSGNCKDEWDDSIYTVYCDSVIELSRAMSTDRENVQRKMYDLEDEYSDIEAEIKRLNRRISFWDWLMNEED